LHIQVTKISINQGSIFVIYQISIVIHIVWSGSAFRRRRKGNL